MERACGSSVAGVNMSLLLDVYFTSIYALIDYNLEDGLIVVYGRCVTSGYNSSECEFSAEFITFK